MDKKSRSIKRMTVIGIVFLLLVIAVLSFASSKSASIRRFVKNNSVELTQYTTMGRQMFQPLILKSLIRKEMLLTVVH